VSGAWAILWFQDSTIWGFLQWGASVIPGGPYDVIIADPPWRFTSNSEVRRVRADRASDERILQWLRLRVRGFSPVQIGRHMGVNPGQVIMATKRIRDADIRESGEAEAAVRAAYPWAGT
jgi:hypothetical protein